VNIALLLVRVVVGVLLAGHGAQKLFGWFGGYGLAGTGGFFESIGYKPGRLFAFLAGFGEFAGGLVLALGFVTPLAGAAVVAVMANAIVAGHWGKGPWASNGGWELPLTYGAVGAASAFAGPGRFSLDHAFGWTLAGNGWGIAAAAAGLGAAAVTLAIRAVVQSQQRAAAAQADPSVAQAA
jgi:putative oxidoreductase